MEDSSTFDIGVATEGTALRFIADDFSSEVSQLGLVVASESRASGGLKASLDWVIPTALSLFLANKYLGTLLQEAAKDHYPLMRRALLRLIRRTTGSEREVTVSVVSSPSAKLREAETATLSIWIRLRDSRRAVFRFDHSLSPADASLAVDEMFTLVLAHQRADPGSDMLARAQALVPYSSWAPVVMRFDLGSQRWRCWTTNRNGESKPWDAA